MFLRDATIVTGSKEMFCPNDRFVYLYTHSTRGDLAPSARRLQSNRRSLILACGQTLRNRARARRRKRKMFFNKTRCSIHYPLLTNTGICKKKNWNLNIPYYKKFFLFLIYAILLIYFRKLIWCACFAKIRLFKYTAASQTRGISWNNDHDSLP